MDWFRTLSILLTQLGISIFFFILSYKILKRNRNGLNICLSLIYTLPASAFLINAIYLFIPISFIIFVLYFITIYLIFLGLWFLIILNLNVKNAKVNSKIQYFLIISYSIALFFILSIPDGIKIIEIAEWPYFQPKWEWSFSIFLIIFISSAVLVPNFILSINILKKIEDKSLKKKWRFYFIGLFGYYLNIYGGIIYNTWNDPTFKVLWSSLSLLSILWNLLIYYGVGQNL